MSEKYTREHIDITVTRETDDATLSRPEEELGGCEEKSMGPTIRCTTWVD